MEPRTRTREYREGWTGRRRNYKCTFCGDKFQHDGGQLPKKARICVPCRLKNPDALKQFEKVMSKRGESMETILKIECMYCRKAMGEKDGQGVEGTSHGICEECWSERFPGIPYPDLV